MRRCYSNDFFCARIRVPEASETDAFSVVVVVVAISPGGFSTQQLRRLFPHFHARDNFARPGKTRDFVSLWPNSSFQRQRIAFQPFASSFPQILISFQIFTETRLTVNTPDVLDVFRYFGNV